MFVSACRHGIGENEEGAETAEFLIEPFDQQPVLVVEHCLESHPADIALSRPIDCIAERHVVGRHRLGHRPGGPAYMEKTTGDFLPGADLGEGPVFLRIEIDLERFFVRPELHLRLL